MKNELDKMFALDQSFMFRFEAEGDKPEGENHKIIPTYKAIAALGMDAIQALIRQFLWRSDIQWKTFDGNNCGNLYYPKSYQNIGLSPSVVSGQGITRKVVWVMTAVDIDEINGVASHGNHRV